MRKRRILGLAFAAALGLAGCTQDDRDLLATLPIPAASASEGELSPRVRRLIDADAPRVQLALVETEQATLAFLESRRDGVSVWLTPDEASVMLREGVLIGTRGLGAGLISADVADTLALLRQRRAGMAARHHSYLTGENATRRLSFTCQIERRGPREIAIGGTPRASILMAERCTGDEESFTNLYWLAPSGWQILQSRQWTGPRIGALATQIAP